MPPRALSTDISLFTLWEEAIYYKGRLLREPLSRPLAEAVDPFLARTKDAVLEQLDRWAAESTAQADVDGENYALDATVEEFGEDKIDVLRSDHPGWKAQDARNSSEFHLYFKTGRPYDVIKMALEAELKAISSYPDVAAKEQDPTLAGYAPRFAAHLAGGRAALERRSKEAAKTAEHRARGIEVLIADFNAFRLEHYEQLLAIARENKRPRGFAEQFARKGAVSTGLDAAEARGRATTILGVLGARGLAISGEQRAAIRASRDADQLDAWTAKVATVATAAEMLAES